jgi:hypothetical protein
VTTSSSCKLGKFCAGSGIARFVRRGARVEPIRGERKWTADRTRVGGRR